MNIRWLLLVLSLFSSSYSAVHKGTLIHTTAGLVPVQQITPSDCILSSGPTSTCRLIKSNTSSNYVYEIRLESESLYVSAQQPLYDPVIEEWIEARKLTQSNTLVDIHGNTVPCLGVKKLDTKKIVYELSLSSFHLFFIGKTGILAHNTIVFLAPAIPTTLATIAKTSTIIGTIFGALWKAHSDRKHAATPSSDIATTAFPPPLKPPDKDNSLQSRRKRAKELAKKLGFKEVKDHKFYSHGEKVFRKGNLEITLDRDVHNGGFWKMFRKKTTDRLGTFNYNLKIRIGN